MSVKLKIGYTRTFMHRNQFMNVFLHELRKGFVYEYYLGLCGCKRNSVMQYSSNYPPEEERTELSEHNQSYILVRLSPGRIDNTNVR